MTNMIRIALASPPHAKVILINYLPLPDEIHKQKQDHAHVGAISEHLLLPTDPKA